MVNTQGYILPGNWSENEIFKVPGITYLFFTSEILPNRHFYVGDLYIFWLLPLFQRCIQIFIKRIIQTLNFTQQYCT
jgi:hypothetical protein